ncbi:hypothetical protein LSTR_LSTR012529 [Laodelphax striatellus]|uniref:C2H2-type domain-containing protein n=1 Tax=Laodelphax striatellus TaxID=195883 RepID=A0A482XLA8_LAOST|nr:hypothetical protein LSTR_LSTR012529 [Laodelphax striatellus]
MNQLNLNVQHAVTISVVISKSTKCTNEVIISLTCWFECSNEMKWLEHLKEEKKKNCSTDCCLFYESIDEFRQHVSELSTVGGYVCGACGMTYHCEEYLKLHLRVHGLEHGSKTTTEARLPESSGSQKEATKKVIDRLKNSHKNIQFETLNNILNNKIDLKQFQTSSTAPGGRVFTGFMCFKCSGILKTEKKFRIHIENHFMMTCHCKRDFHGIKRLRDHFQCCGFKRRICVQCRNDVWLNSTTEYLEHLSFHQKRRICIYCQQILPTTDKLVKHINSLHNTGETKEWFCEYCNETLVVSKSLDTFKFNHFKERHPDRLESFVCEVCGESFNRKKSLATHTKVKHLGEKMYNYTFICAYCSKEFSSKFSIKKHILRHMNEKTFKCTICDKAFNRESSLYKHNLDMHSVKKHMCNVCGKRFSYPSELRNHVKKVHAYVKPARCEGKSGSHSLSKDGYTTDQQGVRAHSMSKFGYATDQPANVRDYPMSTNGCVTGQPGAHSMSADSQFQNPYPGMDYYFYDRPFPPVPRTDPLHQVTHDF